MCPMLNFFIDEFSFRIFGHPSQGHGRLRFTRLPARQGYFRESDLHPTRDDSPHFATNEQANCKEVRWTV
jgi:hypothetical protein